MLWGGSEYICFVDSDDYLELDAIECIAQILSNNQVDFVCCNSYYALSADNIERKDNIFFKKGYKSSLVSSTEVLQESPQIHFYAVWLFIYNRAFLQKNKLFFEPNIYYEDVLFTSYAFSLADSIYITDTPYYYYRISRDGSIMNTLSKIKLAHSAYSHFTIAKRFLSLSAETDIQLKKDYLRFWGCFYLKETLRKLQIIGYAKDLGFSKDDLRGYLPYISGKYRFCFHFPRIYGFPKRVRLFCTGLLSK